MRKHQAPICDPSLAYCTNVHAGATLTETLRNLETYTVAVKAIASPNAPLGVGLWFSSQSAHEARYSFGADQLRNWLAEHGLYCATINGFPYGNFHTKHVKHTVYTPDWSTYERLAYTLNLAHLFAALLPENTEGRISTLPLGWRNAQNNSACLANFLRTADALAQLESETGRRIGVDLEPEPGCALDTTHDVILCFNELRNAAHNPSHVDRYLGVCHDVCHAAVMFESQEDSIRQYAEAHIRVGKMQISSAILAPLGTQREDSLAALCAFAEDRYLHQTTIGTAGNRTAFYDDLPAAIEALARGEHPEADEARVHFHVPIFADSLGPLRTTNHEILPAIRTAIDLHTVSTLEIETYAWPVLPAQHQPTNLADGIATEFDWLRTAMAGITAP